MSGEVERRFHADTADLVKAVEAVVATNGLVEMRIENREGGLAIDWAGIDAKVRSMSVYIVPSAQLPPGVIRGEVA